MPEQNTMNRSSHSIGALIVIIFAVLAIILALIVGGTKLFGGDSKPSGENPSGDIPDLDEPIKTELWPSDDPLSSYPILGGTLIVPTSDYVPVTGTLQTIVNRDEDDVQFFLSSNEMQIDKEANEALLAMTNALNAACTFDEILLVHTVYSTEYDSIDYRSGMTVRFRLSAGNTTKYLKEATGDNPVEWLEENAWKYGFILRYPEGSTLEGKESGVSDIYRYVGIPHAYYITKMLTVDAETNDNKSDNKFGDDSATPATATLEDYIKLAKQSTAKAPIRCAITGTTADNGLFHTYYIAADSVSKAAIAEGHEIYSVSGDGAGYIVTTWKPSATNQHNTTTEKSTEDSTEKSGN